MKSIYCILAILFSSLSLFGQELKLVEKIDSIQCAVERIDSVDNFYLINFQSDKNKYKVVSRKIHNTCSNLYVGKSYILNLYTIFPTVSNYLDQRYHIGGNTFVMIDWGTNLYEAEELCGLCYETDTIKSRECRKTIKQENTLENAMLYIYFHYNIKNIPFVDFYEEQKTNSVNFILYKGEKVIPVYTSPEILNSDYGLFDKSIESKEFYGKILYEYKNLYFIQGCYENMNDRKVLGWIDKKYFQKLK